MRARSRNAAVSEDLMAELGDTNLADHFHPPDPAPGTVERPGDYPLAMGTDGDDVGRRVKVRTDGNGDPERTLAELAPIDLMEANQGFLIRTVEAPKTTWRTTCQICDRPLPPSSAGEWFCENGSLPGTADWDTCRCNWCLIRGQWLRGEYRPRGGRPAEQCGLSDCKRVADKLRKRKSRGTKVPEALLPLTSPPTRRGLRKSTEGGGRW